MRPQFHSTRTHPQCIARVSLGHRLRCRSGRQTGIKARDPQASHEEARNQAQRQVLAVTSTRDRPRAPPRVTGSPPVTDTTRSLDRQYCGLALQQPSHRWPDTCSAHWHGIYQHAGVPALLFITQPTSVTLVSIGLEGKLLGAWVEEARQIVADARASDRVCLNLQGLMFADSRGIELLRTLRREGVPLVGCSALIEGLLAANEASANGVATPAAPSHDE